MKKSSPKKAETRAKIIEKVWRRVCDKYEAFVEIDEEYKLEDSMTSDLEAVLSIFMRIRSNRKSPISYSKSQISDILESLVVYNKKHKEVLLITDEERFHLTSLVGLSLRD